MTVRLNAEQTVFQSERIMTAIAVFAFRQMIADAIFAAELMHAEVRRLRTELHDLISDRTALLATLQIDRLYPFFVFFFGQLFIENAVLLLVQADAPEAVAATEAVSAKLAITAVGTVLTVVSHITIRTVDALGTPLAAQTEREAAAADALTGVACEVHVFGVEDPEAVVAILGAHGFREITVLGPVLDQVVTRFAQKKPLKLLDEVHIILVGKEIGC